MLISRPISTFDPSVMESIIASGQASNSPRNSTKGPLEAIEQEYIFAGYCMLQDVTGMEGFIVLEMCCQYLN